MSQKSVARQHAEEQARKFTSTPSKTLARKLWTENPELFTSFNAVYSMVRAIRGAMGKQNRKTASDKSLFIPHRKPNEHLNRLPEGKVQLQGWKPLKVGECKALILCDVHVPFHDPLAVHAAINRGKEEGCDTVILNGDFMDAFSCSSFRKDPRLIDFSKEIKMGLEVLRFIRSEFPKARIIFKEGNHDERLEFYLIDKAPILLDTEFVSWPTLLHFDELKIEHVKHKRPIRLGLLNVIHGHEYKGGISHPVNIARGLYLKTQEHALCGHWHRNSHHSEVDIEGKVTSTWSVGCLCDLRPAYNPLGAKWQHGAAIVEVLDAKGRFMVTPLHIIRGVIH